MENVIGTRAVFTHRAEEGQERRQWRWSLLYTSNGQEAAKTSEGYTNREECLHNFEVTTGSAVDEVSSTAHRYVLTDDGNLAADQIEVFYEVDLGDGDQEQPG